MVRPINRLRACMQRVGEGDLDVQCSGIRTNDEIGALARGFQEMVEGLREKRLLEKEMLSTERLAALGQVAAGVAHEINNPLGGMLNAIQASPGGGRVGMQCAVEGHHLLLRVEDEGPGIDTEDIQRLFEPFYSGTGGHGLGLWVTYQVISQLGGSIDVLPRSPGTVMEIRLPFPREDRPGRATCKQPTEVPA